MILGWLILVVSGVLFITLGQNIMVGDPLELPIYFRLIAVMGLSYSVIHQQKYPIQAVLIVYVVETFILIIYKDDLGSRFVSQSMTSLMGLGVVFILSGPKLTNAISYSVSPLQKYLKSIGLRLSIPVIVGVIGFTIACAGLSF